ncbi:repeat protein [Peptoniphilus sp. DNF00840]|nr:repeat protein [Peptoniphilus sp. DNF00840]
MTLCKIKKGESMKRKIISSLLLLFMLMSTIIAQPVLAKSEGNVVGQKLTFNAKDFGLSEYESTQTRREQSYRAKNPIRVKRYARLFSNGVSFRSVEPDPQLGFNPKTEFLFPLRLQILTKNSKAGTEAGGINLNDIGLKDGFKIKINQIDSRGNIKNVFESDEILQDGLTATDAKTGNAKGIVTFKYAAGSEDVTEGRRIVGEKAENVRIYDDYGKAFDYEIVADDAVEYNIQLRVRKGNADPAYNKDYIHIELHLIQIANSTMKNEVVDKNGKDIKSELKDGQKLIAYFGRIQGGANYFIDFSKKQTVLRKDFGDQKLIALNDLSIISKNRYHLRRAENFSWNEDGYVTLKDKQDKDIAFKVETSYDCVKGGLVKFIKQDKVIIPDEPGQGETPTPCPSTHYEVNFKAGANGTLKTGMKTRFFVQKGLTWGEAKEAEPKLTVPVPVPNTDNKFVAWYKEVNGALDKKAGLPEDTTTVETATYQAEFTGKDKVVDKTPDDPNVTPELPKKPNPDFDPSQPEGDNNKREIPDDDYELITFKSDEHGFLNAGKNITRKVYAVLKTSTWADAKSADPKMDVPSIDSTTLKLTGADNYTFTKWTKDGSTEISLPEGTKKISELTDKTFIAKFEQNEIKRGKETTEPIPDGYIRLKFSAGENGTIATDNKADLIIDVLEKANKKVGDYTKPKITPNVGYSQKKDPNAWDKADTLVINSTNATSEDKKELTVTAQYDKKKSIIDITPKPPTPPTPGTEPEDPKGPTIPDTNIPDPDYIVVAFKAGANGKIKGGNKFYAILKNMTWKEAKEYTPDTTKGEAKLVIPSEFEPETGYGFVNWNPTLPTDENKKLEKLVQAGETKLTYIAKFDKDIKEDDNKDEEGYLRVVFDGNGGILKGNVKNSYKVRVGVAGVAGSESSKKTYADLARFSATNFVATDNTTDDGITPPIDQKFKEWRKGEETKKLDGATEIQGTSKSVITVKAYYESETALVVPSITQTVSPALPADKKDDDNTAQKVLKVNFSNDPTTGATYKIVKEDGTEVATVTNPQKGDNYVEIPNTVVDKDIVKVKVTKPGMNEKTSDSITLDLAGPTFADLKIVKKTPHIATITGKVTDTPAGVYWVKIKGKGPNQTDTFVEIGTDGAFSIDMPITTDDEYTLTAKDNLANISEKKTSTGDVDKNNSFDKSKIKKVTIEQGYAGEKEILVFAEEGATVKLYKVNGGNEISLGEVTISSGMGSLSISDENGLVANERIYAIVIKDVSNNDISKFNTPAIMTVRPVTGENVTPPTNQPQAAAEGSQS